LYSTAQDTQSHCFSMFTDFVTGWSKMFANDHRLSPSCFAVLPRITPRRTAELQVFVSYIKQSATVNRNQRKFNRLR
jgi:hypothetical protein